ncbi:MAG: hypothetical protein HY287_08925 [Planctomycetes bacterium]|nr:hypothetical protein [Planctomycetota bacterium]MBI3834436.1 hypothetical protein [Planctomycetota bacterium]
MRNCSDWRLFSASVGLLLACASCGLLSQFQSPQSCTGFDVNSDANVTRVYSGDPPSSSRRILEKGDYYSFSIVATLVGHDQTFSYSGFGSNAIMTETTQDSTGATVNIETSEEYYFACEDGRESDFYYQSYFTQDESGLIWLHGGTTQSPSDSPSPYLVIDPPSGKYFRTPELLVVGAEQHVNVIFDNGDTVYFDDRIAGVDDVDSLVGRIRAFRIERSVVTERSGRVTRVENWTDWLSPELGVAVRTRSTTTEYPDDRNVQTTVFVYELSYTNVPLPNPPGDSTAPQNSGSGQ